MEIDCSRFGYIYRITHTESNTSYVGMHRINKDEKFYDYMGSGRIISNYLRKYGIQSFSKEILEYCDSIEELKIREQELILEEQSIGGAQLNLEISNNSIDEIRKCVDLSPDDMYDMYIVNKNSTREISDKYGISQPVIVRYISELKKSDPRFVNIVERMQRNPRKHSEEVLQKIVNTKKSKDKVVCSSCGRSFSYDHINVHQSVCLVNPMPKCEVCDKILTKRSAKKCGKHKYS